MSLELIDSIIGSASEAGVILFVITGGEPYMRPEMMSIYRKYRDALFLTITNGTLIDENTALDIAESKNIFPIVSIEGAQEQTDARRGAGVYIKALRCMSLFKEADINLNYA